MPQPSPGSLVQGFVLSHQPCSLSRADAPSPLAPPTSRRPKSPLPAREAPTTRLCSSVRRCVLLWRFRPDSNRSPLRVPAPPGAPRWCARTYSVLPPSSLCRTAAGLPHPMSETRPRRRPSKPAARVSPHSDLLELLRFHVTVWRRCRTFPEKRTAAASRHRTPPEDRASYPSSAASFAQRPNSHRPRTKQVRD